jgi:hypothetical protein
MDVRFQAGAVCEQIPDVKRLFQPMHPPGPCVGGYRRAHHPDGLFYVFSWHDFVISLQSAFRQAFPEHSAHETIDLALAQKPLDQGTVARHHRKSPEVRCNELSEYGAPDLEHCRFTEPCEPSLLSLPAALQALDRRLHKPLLCTCFVEELVEAFQQLCELGPAPIQWTEG